MSRSYPRYDKHNSNGGGVIGVVAMAAIIGVSLSESARSAATTTNRSGGSNHSGAGISANVMPMEKAGNEFPSLDITVETEEPET